MTTANRLLLAAALGYVAVFGLPTAVFVPQPSVSVEIEKPSAEMEAIVEPVAAALRSLSPVDRALWAQVWSKAAIVVEGDAVATEVAFTDTRALRAFTILALDIAWRRIGGNLPGSNEALRTATEAAYVKAIGVAATPVTKDTRAQYAAFARAMAWAGTNRG